MTQVAAPPAAITCVRHGLNWRLDWCRRSIRVKNSLGMQRLTVLLNNPGVEIHALDLAATLHNRGEGTPTGRGQPVLDRTALSQYRLRIAQLTAEIDEHQARNDHVGTARLQVEYDWLIDELSAVTGIGGQVRDFTDRGERARIAVGKTIRRALMAITALDTELGEHLRDNVHTGTRCIYWPPPFRT